MKQCKTAGAYRDGHGLILRIEANGTKRWVLRATVKGKRRDIGLGSARDVSLKDARDLAYELRLLAKKGQDPVAHQRTARQPTLTFRESAIRAHRQRTGLWRNGKHRDQWLNTLRDYAYPVIGDKAVSTVARSDVLKILEPIWITKAETARRVRQRIRAVLEWATVAGHREGPNPVDGVNAGLPKQPKRNGHFEAMPYPALPGFMRSLRQPQKRTSTSLALEFLVLTVARTGEVIGATPEEIDLDARIWILPPMRMKGDREHRVPLCERALDIVKEARRRWPKSKFLFPGQRNRPLSNMAFAMLFRRLGRSETVHGIRSTMRDWASETTHHSREVCEMALAHVVEDRVEAAYRRGDLFQKRLALMEDWEKYVLGRQYLWVNST